MNLFICGSRSITEKSWIFTELDKSTGTKHDIEMAEKYSKPYVVFQKDDNIVEPSVIYLDMDGVLADFDNGLRELLNMEPMPQDHQTQAFQNEMWTKMAEYKHFYRDLKPLSGAVEGFSALWNKYGNRVQILSGIPKTHRGIVFASEDKTKWVRNFLNDEIKVNLVYRAEKKNFCKDSTCILIDDYESNIKEWTSAGGTGILFTGWDEILKLSTEK